MDFDKEIIFSSSEPNYSRKLSQAEADGKLRKIAFLQYFAKIICWHYANYPEKKNLILISV